jgi:hypothetical protein
VTLASRDARWLDRILPNIDVEGHAEPAIEDQGEREPRADPRRLMASATARLDERTYRVSYTGLYASARGSAAVTDQPSQSSSPNDHERDPIEIDISVAQPARLHNYLAGGAGNFAADRDVADYLSAVLPGGLESARATVRALGSFMVRAVRHLVSDLGVRQFLYIGASIPTKNDIHEVAQEAAPEARVVYVGSDPVVLAHAHARRRSTPEGATAYVHGDVDDPQMILEGAAATLDLTRPVAVMLLATLNFVPDENDPDGIVARLLEGVSSGSYVVMAQTTNDIQAEGMAEAAKRLSETIGEPYVVRSHAEIARSLDGLELVDPGLVPIDDWRRPADRPRPEQLIPIYAAVGRKP